MKKKYIFLCLSFESKGADVEVAHAKAQEILVFYSIEQLVVLTATKKSKIV